MSGDIWQQLADMLATEREHSAVSGETYRKLREIVDAAVSAAGDLGVAAPESVVARLAVEELSAQQLKEIVTDWLRSQTAI